MKIIANKPDEDQSYKNNFKENGVYPFSKIKRVITDKKTGQILQVLNENDSSFDRDFKKSIFDETKHDIMCMFPKFYYRRNWEDEELEDCIVTDIPPEHINFIPENILDKGFEVFPCFVREDGTIRDYVLYSAFEGSIVDGQLRSIPNEEVVVDKTLGELRDSARSKRDEKFNLENMSVIAMIQFLYKIGFQDLNSQKVLGKGWVSKKNKTKTGGTLKLGNRSGYQDPFANSPDKPDDRISLSFRAGENGELAMYNARGIDPMPIKTRNMAGLQKWEETDDYIIYLDKNAVMTTVANYATGTYDLFLEIKADIDGAMELLKAKEIEWTSEDDSKLILDINKDQLERIANTPTTMKEEDFAPRTFATRAVPTTYECCFRVDKKSGEIYIGEGYENLVVTASISGGSKNVFIENGIVYATTDRLITPNVLINRGLFEKENYCFAWDVVENDVFFSAIRSSNLTDPANNYSSNLKNGQLIFSPNSNALSTASLLIDYVGSYDETVGVKLQITKTSTPKPFVKSVMPSGKLAFVTPATSETHSFVMKDFKSIRFYHCSNSYNWDFETAQIVRSDADNNTKIYDVAISKTCRIAKRKLEEVVRQIDIINVGKTDGTLTFSWRRQPQDAPDGTISFTQLLIYKGNLTEEELKAESSKDIIGDNQLDNNEYPAEYNSISLFGIENFYGNVKRIVDGFIAKDDGYYHTAHPNKMGQTSAYEKLPCQVITGGSNGIEGWSKKIDKNLGVFNIPSELNEQKNVLVPVTPGLIEWFDFADGKGTETTLKSRVSDNVLTLSGFNFDENGGWTGKGLKFDGVDDWCINNNITISKNYTIEITFVDTIVNESNYRGYFGAGSNSRTRVSMQRRFNHIRYQANFGADLISVSSILNKNTTVSFSSDSEVVKVFLNGNDTSMQMASKYTQDDVGFVVGRPYVNWDADYKGMIVHSIKIYNVVLTPEEIAQNYEYEQSIDRTTVSTYPLLQEQKSYGIGLSNQLSDEQKASFRLSLDGTKFVAGMRYCEGLEVEEFTYSEIQVEMEKEKWSAREEEFEVDTTTIKQNTKIQLSTEENRLTSKSDTKTSEETHYTDYFISHAPNKENIAIFGSDFEAEEKAGVFTLDLNKEINHKDDRTSARLVILP